MNNDTLTINTKYKRNIGYQFFSLSHKFLALIIIAWLNNGIFTYLMPYYPNFLRWGTFAIWFFIAILCKPKFTKVFFSQTWPLLLFFVYIYSVSFFTNYPYIFVYTNNITYLIMVYAIFLFYFDKYYKEFVKLVVIFMSIDYLYVAINTYFKLLEFPLLSRYLSAGAETRELLLSDETFLAVGNYGYFYGLVPIILLLTYLLLNYRINKLLIILFLIGAIVLLVKASFTLAILFAFLFMLTLFIIKYTGKAVFLLIAPLLVILLVLMRGAFANIFNKLANLEFISYDVSVRFYELSYFFAGNNVDGTDLLSRLERYTVSIKAFSYNFISGSALGASNEYTAGGHSSWLDILALFGVFSLLFFLFLVKAFKYIKALVPNEAKYFINVYWLYFLLLGFVNTLLIPNMFTVWFLLIPFYLAAFPNKNKEIN